MKNKSKKSWRKRKHRNGVRPERKGSIKINLSDLPSKSEILDLRFRYTGLDLATDMPKHPELDFNNWYGEENQRRLRQYQHDTDQWAMRHDQWRAMYDRLVNAYKFLESYQQADPLSIALDCLNEKHQPELKPVFYIEDFCDRCKKKNTCPIAKLDWSERMDQCAKMKKAYDKMDAEIINGTYQRLFDYSDKGNFVEAIAEAWEIPNN